MAGKERASDRGREAGRRQLVAAGHELRTARLDRDLSLDQVARAIGCSASKVSRIERGLVEHVSLMDLAALNGVVGLELAVRSFPAGQPLRDVAHVQLLARLRSRLHPSLRWQTEVPLPIIGDLRAWDAAISGTDWRLGVEAETGPRDAQSMTRRLTLKLRDSGFNALILLVPRTRRALAFVKAASTELGGVFTLRGCDALEALAHGVCPKGNAIVTL